MEAALLQTWYSPNPVLISTEYTRGQLLWVWGLGFFWSQMAVSFFMSAFLFVPFLLMTWNFG